MKKRNFLFGALAALAMMGCSDNDLNQENGPQIAEKDGQVYMKVSIANPQSTGTRALDEGFENGTDGTENENKIEKIKSDLDLIKKFREKFENDNRIHILSDNPNTKNDDMSLQTQFFKTILLFLPKLNLEKSSKNPLNIALILLS